MQETDKTLRRAMSVAWLIAWRFFVGEILLSIAVGFVLAAAIGAKPIIGLVEAALGPNPGNAGLLAYAIVGAINIVWIVVVIRMALRKQYKDFRIALVAR